VQSSQAPLESEARAVARWRRLWNERVKFKWSQKALECTDRWNVSDG